MHIGNLILLTLIAVMCGFAFWLWKGNYGLAFAVSTLLILHLFIIDEIIKVIKKK